LDCSEKKWRATQDIATRRSPTERFPVPHPKLAAIESFRRASSPLAELFNTVCSINELQHFPDGELLLFGTSSLPEGKSSFGNPLLN
jgi:hypothetical protein